jgi:hypothetical protein
MWEGFQAMRKSVGARLIWLLLLAATGCGTYSNHLTARATKPGAVDLGVNLDVIATERGSRSRSVLPNPEIMVRVGLAKGFDLGGKINFLGAELSSRIGFIEGDFDLAFAPGIGFSFATRTDQDDEALVFTGKLPLLAGVHLGEIVTLVGGFSGIFHVSAGSNESDNADVILYPGGTFGVDLQLAPIIALFPEINVHAPYHVNLERWRKAVFQAGLSVRLTFGGD